MFICPSKTFELLSLRELHDDRKACFKSKAFIRPCKDTRQEEVKDKTDAVKKCNDDQAAAISKISSGIKKQTDDFRKEHQACRKEEKDVHHAHKVKTCKELTSYLTEIEEKSPEKPTDTDDDDAMVEWVEATQTPA